MAFSSSKVSHLFFNHTVILTVAPATTKVAEVLLVKKKCNKKPFKKGGGVWAWDSSSHSGVVFLKASPPKSPLSWWILSEFIRRCPASVLPVGDEAHLWGSTDLRPDFPKSACQTGKRKWGHGGTLETCFSFLAVLKGNPGYYSSLVLLIMHAEGFHCPSCPTNCGMRICHRLLDAAWKDPIFIFIHGGGLDLNDFISCRVSLHEETWFIASAVCGNCCLGAARFPTWTAKKKQTKNDSTIDLFCVSRKSLGIPVHHWFFFIFQYSHMESESNL